MTDYRKQTTPVWSTDLDAGDTVSLEQARGLNQRRLADFGLTLEVHNARRVTVRRMNSAESRIHGGYYKSLPVA